MKVFKVKFGEEGNNDSYTDDTRLAAASVFEAAQKAKTISEKNIRMSDADFTFDKSADGSRSEQKKQWHKNALQSWEPTSIIFESELEDTEVTSA